MRCLFTELVLFLLLSSHNIFPDAGGGGNLPAIKETSQLTEKWTSKGPLALPKICNRMNLLLLEGATGGCDLLMCVYYVVLIF